MKVPLKTAVVLAMATVLSMKNSGVYTISNFGGVKCSNTRVYCDITSHDSIYHC